MKVQVKVNARTILEAEGEEVKAVFELLSNAEDVFGQDTCGRCGSQGVKHVCKHVDKFVYYSLQCLNRECRAEFKFGQRKEDGTLFPKYKDDDGNWKPNGGWEQWTGAVTQNTHKAIPHDHDDRRF